MGIFCPECKQHRAIVRNVTHDGGPVTAENPILARVLDCGHTVSGEKHKEFIERVNSLRAEEYTAIADIKKNTTEKISALWATLAKEGKAEVH